MDVLVPHARGAQLTVATAADAVLASASPRVPSMAAPARTGRHRLARDLHDGVGESINTLLVQIRLALARGEAGLEDLRLLEQGAQNAMQSVRALAYGARRGAKSNPLEEARLYAEQLLMASGVSLTWIDELLGIRLTNKLATQLGWAVRESVTNVARHANARAVEVRLNELEGRVRVTVRDDGDGFLPEAVKVGTDGRGLGLLGNAERMAEVGGLFSVRSSPGDGAEVLLEAPLRSRQDPETQVMLPLDSRTLALTAG